MCIRSTVSLRISVLYTVLEPPDLSNFRGILVSPYLIYILFIGKKFINQYERKCSLLTLASLLKGKDIMLVHTCINDIDFLL